MMADATTRGRGWTAIKEAVRNNQMLEDVEAKINAYLEMNKLRPPEIAPRQEIVGTLTAGDRVRASHGAQGHHCRAGAGVPPVRVRHRRGQVHPRHGPEL